MEDIRSCRKGINVINSLCKENKVVIRKQEKRGRKV